MAYINSPWPVKDIVYTSIVGTIMIAALLEWFLWLAAFLFCLVKAYQKAEHWSVKVIAVVIALLFTAIRFMFLPIMIVTLPLPDRITQYFPPRVVAVFQWIGFWTFAILLSVPWLICLFRLVTHSIGRKKNISLIVDPRAAPKVVIVMPCYHEEPDVLITAIDSVVDCDYPPSCIHVFLSFDGDQQDDLYLDTIKKLGVPILDGKIYPKSLDVIYRTARITVSRFPHGGKRKCQKYTYKLIDKVYTDYQMRNDNLYILFIDSDCILDRACLQNFMYYMELSPGNKGDMLAMTGVITSTTKKHSLITLLQDMEYVHGQLFERTVETACGSVTCLPGALTMLRFSSFRTMAKYYFEDKAEKCTDLFDYGKCHLGEDRWLTHLFMVGAKKPYQIQMCPSAFCKTEAVQTISSLVKQRRRWFLGFITNEVCMMTDRRLWRKYPLLLVVRFMQNTIRTTALLFFIMVVSLMTTSKTIHNLPVEFIAVSLGLNWLLMIYFGIKLHRYKVMLYPLLFAVNPFFNWYYMVYGIFTAGQRTWGGPRADAGKADAVTTAQEVVEKADILGDELNVVPETFTDAHHAAVPVPLQPPERLEGRFTAAERLPGGWYGHPDDSMVSLGAGAALNVNHELDFQRRSSFESNNSVFMPRRVESIMGEEDQKKYALAQANQRAAGGAYMIGTVSPEEFHRLSDVELRRHTLVDPVDGTPPGHLLPPVPSASASPDYFGRGNLPIPQTAHRGNRRSSPLARASFERSASDADFDIELAERGA